MMPCLLIPSEINTTQKMLVVGGFGFLNPNGRSVVSSHALSSSLYATIYKYHLIGALMFPSAPAWAVLTSL